MAEYTVEMFREDFEKVVPIMLRYRNQETLDQGEGQPQPENAVLDILDIFTEKYGSSRGIDFQMRFLSVMQFVEHYQKDLEKEGLLNNIDDGIAQVPGDLLLFLLESIRSPQPPSPYPSSPLYNQNHEFNYKKIIKAVRAAAANN
jgi:hypothetical protein